MLAPMRPTPTIAILVPDVSLIFLVGEGGLGERVDVPMQVWEGSRRKAGEVF